jgi:hypothetical protein
MIRWALSLGFGQAAGMTLNNVSITLSKELGLKQIRVNALNTELVITEGLWGGRASWREYAI